MRTALLCTLLVACGDDSVPPPQTGPTVLATALANPIAVALDPGHVYVANSDDGSVVRLRKGGTQVETLATTAPGLRGLAVDAQWVYVTNNVAGTVSKIPLAGGAPQTIAMGLDHPTAILATGGAAYWLVRGSTGGQPGSVMALSPAGAVTTLAANQSFPAGIAYDDANLYWANGRDGSMWKIAFDGSGLTQLRAPGTPLSDVELVFSDGVLYVVGGGISSMPAGGGDLVAEMVSLPQGLFTSVALENGEMYLLWKTLPLGAGTDAIWAYAPYRTQQRLIPIVAGLPSALGVAADATDLYWTESGTSGNGALLRMKR